MKTLTVFAGTVFLLRALCAADLSFVQNPVLVKDNGQWRVEFTVSESTDVEVSIVNVRDSSVVRRLAAGVLGANPPPPFTANSLHQTIAWDGKDDLGAPVSDTSMLSVRVRAGLSVALDKMTPDNPYYFGSISGFTMLEDATFLVQGLHEYGKHGRLRQYDKYGRYLRTLFPFPAGLNTPNTAAWNVIEQADGTYCPRYATYLDAANITASLGFKSDIRNFSLMPFSSDDRVFLCNKSNFSYISLDPGDLNRMEGQSRLITYPAAIPNGGPFLFNRGPGPHTVYLSGVYNYLDPVTAYFPYTLADTGFWLDGRIYKLDLETGVASPWHTIIPIDSIPQDLGSAARKNTIGSPYSNPGDWTSRRYAAIHGLAFDDSGRIYVCDRLHGRVAVYDTATWTLQGAISVAAPHLVEVNRRTGDVFVLSWLPTTMEHNSLHLYRYAGFRGNPAASAQFSMDPTAQYNYQVVPSILSSCEDNEGTLLYVGAGSAFLILRGTESGFIKLMDFDSLSKAEQNYSVPVMYERLAVDRRTETVYTSNGWCEYYKIDDWNSCKATPCSTSARQRLYASEAAVSPDGFLYAREPISANHSCGFEGPVKKYAIHGPYLTPAIFKSSNQVHDKFFGKWGAWFADKGLAVSREGKVAILDGMDLKGTNPSLPIDDMDIVLHVTDPDSTFHDSVVYPVGELGRAGREHLTVSPPYNGAGVKFDYNGNLYVGSSTCAPGHVVPPGYATDGMYQRGVGAVYKFPPTGGSIYMDSARGALQIYPQGLGAFSGDDLGSTCRCRSPRFDLDPYGRLYIPNGLLSRVAVTDNNGNDILTFGEYGNVDSKGAGSLVPEPAIPLATPQCVAASDNYIYIADWNNARLVRVRMAFALENMRLPEVFAEKAAPGAVVRMTTSPNPFNPVSNITLSLPAASFVELSVYNALGRLVRTLASKDIKAGIHHFPWDARDGAGRSVSAGLYVYRLTAGNRVLITKTVLAK